MKSIFLGFDYAASRKVRKKGEIGDALSLAQFRRKRETTNGLEGKTKKDGKRVWGNGQGTYFFTRIYGPGRRERMSLCGVC